MAKRVLLAVFLLSALLVSTVASISWRSLLYREDFSPVAGFSSSSRNSVPQGESYSLATTTEWARLKRVSWLPGPALLDRRFVTIVSQYEDADSLKSQLLVLSSEAGTVPDPPISRTEPPWFDEESIDAQLQRASDGQPVRWESRSSDWGDGGDFTQ